MKAKSSYPVASQRMRDIPLGDEMHGEMRMNCEIVENAIRTLERIASGKSGQRRNCCPLALNRCEKKRRKRALLGLGRLRRQRPFPARGRISFNPR